MKTLIGGLLLLVAAAWGLDLYGAIPPAGAQPLWIARQQALYLSGLGAVTMMSLAMLLSTRPAWLETPLGGMDRVYRTHKWAGILAVAFSLLHWLIELSSDLLKETIGRHGRVPKEKFTGFLEILRDLAEDMGEWAIYLVLVMLVITLWKKFPYRTWRLLHRAMPVIFLMLAFHAALLAPAGYWSQPVGMLLAPLLAAGVYGALHSLLGGIGRGRAAGGRIVAIEHPAADVTTVHCKLDRAWRGHRPGQFAFVTFDEREGAHPFTIACADRGDRTITFQIKALGDYTRELPRRLQAGQPVRVEGPYGRFDPARCDRAARQIWIAGGIGVTPFLAWLEALQANPGQAPAADLHYCTRDRDHDPFVARLEALCATLPTIRLQVHGARQGGLLTAPALDAAGHAEVWFCGPGGLAVGLRDGLRALGLRPPFHQEAFEMR